ncbi:MAG TPA: universal stress protein, partial [Terriglobales bacterium]|nr:universal stress protein [Terriglobales bacterium]
MYSKILVPLDGSKLAEQILPFVRPIAEPDNLPVELLTVTHPDARSGSPQAGKQYLQGVHEKYFPSLARVTSHVEIGKAAEVIVERHHSDTSCLIAMATHGMSGLR